MTDTERPVPLSDDLRAGPGPPVMDLIAAAALAAVSVWIMVEALRLPIPGGLATAPGLLPFLTSLSLLVMAGVLAAGALARRRGMAPGTDRIELPDGFGRTMVLGAILVVYVLGLQFLPLEQSLTVGPVRLVAGAFEAVTVVVLTTVLRIYWQKALWLCLVLCVVWVALLSLVFRNVFHIQLP